MIRVTIEIDLNDALDTLGAYESYITDIINDVLEEDEQVVRWDVIKLEVTG